MKIQKLITDNDRVTWDRDVNHLNYNRVEIQQALSLYRYAASANEMDAYFANKIGDGGASVMREIANAYEAGLNNRIPDFLNYYLKEVRMQNDPEYEEYIVLKNKFENIK